MVANPQQHPEPPRCQPNMSGPGATVCWWWWQLKICLIFIPKIGEDEPILTHIFQVGWNLKPPTRFVDVFFFSVFVFFSWEANGAQCLFGPKIPSNTRSFFDISSLFWWWVVLKGRVGKQKSKGGGIRSFGHEIHFWDSFEMSRR